MQEKPPITRIAIIGAESSGKTKLSEDLAQNMDAKYVAEYARQYMTEKEVSYEELEHIAKTQLESEVMALQSNETSILIMDTELINLKIWFLYSFKKMPQWLEEMRPEDRYDFYLVTDNDLPYEEDKLRYFPDIAERNKLRDRYIEEIKKSGLKYELIGGRGNQRQKNAQKAIMNYLEKT